jgi:hypothetical protein
MKKSITANASFLAATQLFVMVNFAIAQPLYDILGQYAEYFTATGSEKIDIFILIIFLSFLLPALLILFELLIKTINEKLYAGLHFFHIFLFAGLGILPILKSLSANSGIMPVLVSCLFGIIISILLFKSSLLKAFFVYLIPVPLIFCSLFLFNPKISAIAFDRSKKEIDVKPGVTDTPVVLVVFDELPTLSLLDRNFEIDRIRYPNLAALADHSYWFRNASSVSDDTLKGAIPSILCGKYPYSLKTFKREHDVKKYNLFRLLSKSHRFNVFETYSNFSDNSHPGSRRSLTARLRLYQSDIPIIYAHLVLPKDYAAFLPSIAYDWKNFKKTKKAQNSSVSFIDLTAERNAIYDSFVKGINNSAKPQFSFLHILFPHLPWSYVPSGEGYSMDVKGLYGVPGVSMDEMWRGNFWTVNQGYQRHLLQVGYIDSLIGVLVQRLKETGVYDKALIIITSDHGVSFTPNASRRQLQKQNMPEILFTPLIIKTPFQQKKIIDDSNVESVDILPIIADLLNIEVPWKMDGQSPIGRRNENRTTKVCFKQNRMKKDSAIKIAEWNVLDYQSYLERKVDMFGAGEDDRLWTFGKYKKLIGRKVTDYTVDYENRKALKAVLKKSPHLPYFPIDPSTPSPVPVTGILESAADENFDKMYLAICINNTIISVTKVHTNSKKGGCFLFFVSQELHQPNSIYKLYTISEINTEISLHPILLG